MSVVRENDHPTRPREIGARVRCSPLHFGLGTTRSFNIFPLLPTALVRADPVELGALSWAR